MLQPLCLQNFNKKNWDARKILTKKISSISSSSLSDPNIWRSQSTFQKTTEKFTEILQINILSMA